MFNLQKLEVDAVLAGVVLLVVLGLGFGTYHFYKAYQDALVVNGQLKTQNDSYLATIKADSDANAKLAADSKAREDAAKAAALAAQAQAKKFEKRATDLLAAQAQYPTDMCKSADALFDQYIGGK